MNFIYELLRAGTSSIDSDSGAEVARKINVNFKRVQDKFSEIEQSIQDIPIGNELKPGIVKSSKSENNVSINTDGTMEVASLNVEKLTQDDDDFIILDGNV